MYFPKLYEGRLIKRYKRFLADIYLENGDTITAHVPNSGAMTSCIEENCKVYVSYSINPKRKLKYTLELTKIDENLICTNTNIANKIVYEAIENGKIEKLQGYDNIKTEQKYGQNSRIDILLEKEDEKCFVEIKSVSLKQDNILAFPDAVTKRGLKHLNELSDMVNQGHRAVMIYVIQRNDNLNFTIAKNIDEQYYRTLQKVIKNGVEVLVYQSKISLEKIYIDRIKELIL